MKGCGTALAFQLWQSRSPQLQEVKGSSATLDCREPLGGMTLTKKEAEWQTPVR